MIGRGIGIPFRHGTGGETSIPPEIKKNIIAWYDPKKQGMTNYDVIEAYLEDFTKWVYRNYRGTVKITNNTIVITNVVETNNIVEDDKEPYSDLTIRVTGVTENKYLIVRQGRGKPETHIKKDGVYTFKDNNLYFGFGVSVIGECNITITQLPTSILKDFSGNGNHAYLYSFKGKLDSGIGIYKIDFSKIQNSAFDNFERLNNKFIAKGDYKGNWSVFGQYTVDGIVKNKVTVKITGASNLSYKLALQYGYITKDSKYIQKEMFISKDGIYSYDINNIEIPDENNIAQTIYNRFYFGEEVINDVNLIVEEIPDYPNQLCYDGKSYAVAYDMPILTDYTVMAERTWFENRNIFLAKGNITTEAKYAFIFERFKPDGVMAVQSFGAWNDVVSTTDSCISYLTKNKYNGIDIRSGIGADDDMLSIGGALNKGNIELTSVCCHGAIIVADRSFTEEEINWLKQNWDKI